MSAEDITGSETARGYEAAEETVRLLGQNCLGVLTQTQENILKEAIAKGQLPGSHPEAILNLINEKLEQRLKEEKGSKKIIQFAKKI